MQIKRYEAKNMTAALRMIKGELGPEAVILSARSIRKGKGIFGSLKYAGVEVTAAIDKQLPDSHNETSSRVTASGARSALQPIRQETESMTIPERQSAVSAYQPQRPNYTKRYIDKNRVEPRNNRVISSIYQRILAQEVDRGIASELVDEIRRIPGLEDQLDPGSLKTHLAAILEEMGVWTTRSALIQERPNILAFVGSTGVGKTTTLAKLAALQATRHNKRVALVSVDNYGIAANEQLKTYARIIGLPLETALNAADLSRAIKRFAQTDLILIDTPGGSPSDPEQILELKSLLAGIPNIQTHLVMCAATKENDLIATTEAFKGIGVQRLVFTKIDESRTFGNIVDVLIRTGLPLSFLSCGRRVPDDIEAGTVQKLVDLLLGVKNDDRLASAEASDANVNRAAAYSGRATKPIQFVANKNSDVYHCMDCKWSARIKAENIIQFNSTSEAAAQNFLPCRSCKPDRRKLGAASEGIKPELSRSHYRQS